MKRGWARVLLFSVVLSCLSASAVEGMFQGKVVEPPNSVPRQSGWIFVQGRNHILRRVEVAHAVIVFGNEVPASQQHQCDMRCLEVGQEVRITAEQDGKGEWRAKRVEILHLITRRA
ncbi:MAG TPA: hypothetical protein VN669_06860 [Candidatus Acidoferrales bacterium]|nr:hypothetical protein [Candidatus Acidoferrales bacterium]